LLADTAGFGATKIDVRLGNAWGIGIDPSNGNMEVGVNHDSAIFVCDRNGTVMRVIAIPKPDGTTGGSPTGVVHNSTSDFGGNTVITATEDGAIIAAGAAGDGKVVSDQSATAAVYKSIAMGSSGGASYIYAANFGKNSVDMFDKNFALHKQFTDPATPANFSAFGVGVFNNYLFVTFARWKVGHHDDSADAGIGFVDEFTLDGTFIKRFIDNGGLLNSPFGLALAGAGFGTFKNALLVGNFGDGRITGYDATTGALIGQLTDKSGTPLTIEGRWGITFNTAGGGDPNFLYYAAGPSGENLGVFGYVQLK
jgi:uncharacterized protein (TIGR03118 family)